MVGNLLSHARLVSLLATLRLLAFAIPQRGGERNVDPGIRAVRCVLRPAPVAMIFLIFAQPVGAMNPDHWNELHGINLRLQLAMSEAEGINVVQDDGGVAAPSYFRSVYEVQQQDLFWDWDDDDAVQAAAEQDEERPDWQAVVEIHYLQAESTIRTIMVRPADTARDISSFLLETLYDADDDRLLYPLRPQPDTDRIHYVATSAWTLGMGLYPVVVDLSEYNGKLVLIYLPALASHDMVKRALGPEWRYGTRLWFGGHDVHTEATEEFEPYIGMLIIAVPWDSIPAACCSLEDRLRTPELWCRDVSAEGLPLNSAESNSVALLGYQARNRILAMVPGLSYAQFSGSVAAACGLHPEGFLLISPERHPLGFELRGRRVAYIRGIQCIEYDDWAGVFIDPRDIGQEVRFVPVPDYVTTLSQLCDLAGVRLPHGWRLQVRGARAYDETSGRIEVQHRGVVRLVVIPYGEGPAPPPLYAASPGPDQHEGSGRDEDEAGDESSAATSRSRTPRRGDGGLPPGPASGDQDSYDDLQPGTVLSGCQLTDVGRRLISQMIAVICPDGNGIGRTTDGGGTGIGMKPASTKPVLDDVGLRRPVATPCRATATMRPYGGGLGHDERVVISVADALGPPCISVEQQCLTVMPKTNADALLSLLVPLEEFELRIDFATLDLHVNTQCALSICIDSESAPVPDVIEIYTDGSAKEGKSGFAVVIVGQGPSTSDMQRPTWVMGYFTGTVVVDPGDPCYLGADTMDALNAEASPVSWAILWALGHKCAYPYSKIAFRFDSLSAGNAASGRWKSESKEAVRTARRIMQFCEHAWGNWGSDGSIPLHIRDIPGMKWRTGLQELRWQESCRSIACRNFDLQEGSAVLISVLRTLSGSGLDAACRGSMMVSSIGALMRVSRHMSAHISSSPLCMSRAAG